MRFLSCWSRLRGALFAVLALFYLAVPLLAQTDPASVDVLELLPEESDYIVSVDPRTFAGTDIHSVVIPELAGDSRLFRNPQTSSVSRLIFAGVLARFPRWEMLVAQGRFSHVPVDPSLAFLGNIGLPVGYLDQIPPVSASGSMHFRVTVAMRDLRPLPELLAERRSLSPLALYADAFLAPTAPPLWGAFRIADFSLENVTAGHPLRPDRLSRLGDVHVFFSLGSLHRGRVRVVLDFENAQIAGAAALFVRNALADAAARSRPLQNLVLRADGSRINVGFNLDPRMIEALSR